MWDEEKKAKLSIIIQIIHIPDMSKSYNHTKTYFVWTKGL